MGEEKIKGLKESQSTIESTGYVVIVSTSYV